MVVYEQPFGVVQSPLANYFGYVEDSRINSPSQRVYRTNVNRAWVGVFLLSHRVPCPAIAFSN